MKKYAERKTAAIEEAEKRKRARDWLDCKLFWPPLAITGSIGWLILQLARL